MSLLPSQFGTIVYVLQKTPGSGKGYSLSARTAARFPPCGMVRNNLATNF